MNLPALHDLQVALERASLAEFVRAGWHVLEPTQPLVWNWHMDALCAELEVQQDCTSGVSPVTGAPIPWTQNLLINIPPGTSKSTLVSVFLPAWMWLRKPSWRSIFASAADNVASRDSQKCRELIESEWYQQRYKPTWKMAPDQNAKMLFKNTSTGFRQAVTVGQKIVGLRADALFVDDPLDATQAHVDSAALEHCRRWWDEAFANRVSNPATSTRTVIMQRLHELDLAGHLLEQSRPTPGQPPPPGAVRHVCIPQEWEPGRGYDGDPRTTAGELLFPERFPEIVLAQERHRLRSSGYAGQHQQRPTNVGGNRYKRNHWQFWRFDDRLNPVIRRPMGATENGTKLLPPNQRFDSVWASVDANMVAGDENDYAVITIVGRIKADRFVLWRWRQQCEFPVLERTVAGVRKNFPTCRRILVEMKANGPAVVAALKGKVDGIIPVPPKITGAGKEARSAVCEPFVESGNYYLPENAPWLDEWFDEFASFPKGAHDDQVDSLSQLEAYWAQSGDAEMARKLTSAWS